jgi:RNA polymerase sigma-70 factor (ECF subfamily)
MSVPPDPAAEELARMEAIVRRMPRLTRDIFMAHRLDGMAYHEIARRTGLTVRQVERHMARAIADLDRGLDREPRPWWKFW